MREFYLKYIKNDVGIVLCILFYSLFYMIAMQLKPFLNGAAWYYESSFQRFLFGWAELFIFVKIFDKKSWRNVMNLTSIKDGMLAGSAVIIYIILFAIEIVIGCKSFINCTFSLVFSCLFLQQITTGFWEELTFRAFLTEGYWKKKNQNWKWRLFYASISFLLFGMIHAVGNTNNLSDAVTTFILTGIMGFAFSAIYLYSHNILAPMLLHFVYDIFANMQSFVEEWNMDHTTLLLLADWVMPAVFGIIFVSSIIFIIKKPSYEN